MIPNIDLKKIRFENNLSQEQLGLMLGVTKQHISKIENGKAKLTEKKLEILRNKFNISLQNQPTNDYATLPVRGGITASMGTGVEIYDENKTGTYQIGKKLLRDIGANQQFSEIIFAQGDSMEPTIEGGDSLLVDLSKTEIYDGKIYCVRIENKLYAKRLQLIPPNKVKVISDNKEKYDPFYIDTSKNINFDFAVIGEVKWWGRVAK